jgi:hypothetical protein
MQSSAKSEWRSLVSEPVQPATRADVRYSASGKVKMMLYEELGFSPAMVEGELLDYSRGGCKIRHQFGYPQPGQQVTILISGMELKSTVMWTRSLGDWQETGFSFLR